MALSVLLFIYTCEASGIIAVPADFLPEVVWELNE
jgi:hypothetical protein